MDQIEFTKGLIKGRIAEIIFEQMFRETKKFDIIPLGYEHTSPELAQYQHLNHIKKVLDNIRNIPDFALVSLDKEGVYLVEVKYRTYFNDQQVMEIAQNIDNRWSPAWLFLASPKGFYFNFCSEIISNHGKIKELDWIEKPIQEKYLSLLKESEK